MTFLGERHRRSSAMTNANKQTTRIVLIGSTKSGKTSIARRFIADEFTEKYRPTVEDAYYRNYKYGKQHFHVEIIDMPSPFTFPVMRDLHVKAANVAMLIYEIDNQASFTEAMDAWKRIRELRGDSLPIVVVGTKKDQMIVTRNAEECIANVLGEDEMAQWWNDDVQHILTSAKDDVGVTEAFEMCLNETMDLRNCSSSSLALSQFSERQSLCCCACLRSFFTK